MKRNAHALLTHLVQVQTVLEAEPVVKSGGLAGGAFLESDGVLNTLNKQRLAAKKNHSRLAKEWGLEDDMVVAAAEQLENIERMYNLRFLQLRKARESSEVIQRAKQTMAMRREAARHQASQAQILARQDKRKKDLQKKRDKDFWFLLVFYILWQGIRQSYRPIFNAPAPRLAL